MDATPFREQEEKDITTREDTAEQNDGADCSKNDLIGEDGTNPQAFIKDGP